MKDATIMTEPMASLPASLGRADAPESYARAQAEALSQLAPSSLLERHYAEKIAAASWRLERLRRWQARLWEDDALTDEERLTKLDCLLRHETNLNRQVDTAVKMLTRDVPRLTAARTHTTPECQNEPAPSPSDSPRIGGWGVIPSASPSLTGRGGEPKANRGGSPSCLLTLNAKGRLVPAPTDAARRLLFSR